MGTIEKKVCDNCKKETAKDEMYVGFESNDGFTIIIKFLAGSRHFPFYELDFCKIECFKEFLEKLLMR